MSASWILLAALTLIGLFAASRAWPVRATDGLRLEGEQKDDGIGEATLSVATYNIHRARGLDGEKNLGRIAELVKTCDVVGLQEVEGTNLFRRHDQASLIGRRLGRLFHFSTTRRLLFFPQRGNGLISRFQTRRWETTPLFPSTGRAHRNMTVYHFEWAGETVAVINTHLSKPSEGESPLEEVMHAFGQYPRAVLLGDFNAPAHHAAMCRGMPPDTKDALSGLDDQDRVDMILVRGLEVDKAWSEPPGPSDHPFFAAQLRLKD